MARLFRAIRAREELLDTKRMRAKAIAAQNRWAKEMIKLLQVYPAPPPDSTYVRTFDLKRGWRKLPTSEGGNTIQTSVVNDVGYAGAVQGPVGPTAPLGQAMIHQGRWDTIVKIKDQTRPAYLAELRKIIATRGR